MNKDNRVKVEIIAEHLIKFYGKFKRYNINVALKGEQQGLWRIIPEENTYRDKELKPGSYLEKTKFRRGLCFENLYGERKKT